jgi:hypothetical protein
MYYDGLTIRTTYTELYCTIASHERMGPFEIVGQRLHQHDRELFGSFGCVYDLW